MPVTQSPGLTLGRGVIDVASFGPDVPRSVVEAFGRLEQMMAARGWSAAAKAGDNVYQDVYAQLVGEDWILYGGKPADPVNPDIITVSAAGSATLIVQWEGSTIGTRGTINFTGAGVNAVTDDAGNTRVDVDITGGGGGADQNLFETIAVSGQSDVVADAVDDTLTLVAGANVIITTDHTTDTITWAVTGLPLVAFKTIAVSGQSDVVADQADDTLTLVAGSNVTLTTSAAGDSITIAASGGGGSGGGHNGVWGYLASDLTVDDASVTINVEDWVGSNPGATVSAANPPDNLHPDPDKYLFVGNATGWARATEYDGGWQLDAVQTPIRKPV